MTVRGCLNEIELEYVLAQRMHGNFNNLHEAYAVILEEVDELWEAVKLKRSQGSLAHIRREAIQIAAMAMKTALHCDVVSPESLPPYPQTLEELAEAQGVKPMMNVRETLFGTWPDREEVLAEARREERERCIEIVRGMNWRDRPS